MKSSSTSGALHALMRTSQWTVDDAQLAHSEAVSLGEQSQQALNLARQQLEESHQRLRQLWNNNVLDAGDLAYLHLQNRHYQQQESAADREHAERMQSVENARKQLLEARVRAETYSRLSKRREQLERRFELHRQQRLSDESGVVRATSSHPFLFLKPGEQHDD
ncbi:MAG: hypothetical protein ABUS47_03675 [Steroidobacter sp.]